MTCWKSCICQKRRNSSMRPESSDTRRASKKKPFFIWIWKKNRAYLVFQILPEKVNRAAPRASAYLEHHRPFAAGQEPPRSYPMKSGNHLCKCTDRRWGPLSKSQSQEASPSRAAFERETQRGRKRPVLVSILRMTINRKLEMRFIEREL